MLQIDIKLAATNDLTQPSKMTSETVENAWVLSLPNWPIHKKTSEKTWMSSLEDLKKKTIHGVQPNLFFIYIYIYIYIYKKNPFLSFLFYQYLIADYKKGWHLVWIKILSNYHSVTSWIGNCFIL